MLVNLYCVGMAIMAVRKHDPVFRIVPVSCHSVTRPDERSFEAVAPIIVGLGAVLPLSLTSVESHVAAVVNIVRWRRMHLTTAEELRWGFPR